MSSKQAAERPSRVVEVIQEVRVAAPRERVWKALAEEAGSWWPSDFFTSERAKRFVLEARPGGLGLEDWGDGEGLVWYTVTAVERGSRLEMAGDLHPEFNGPGRLLTRFSLRDEGGGTVVRLSEVAFGHVADGLEESLQEGWKILLAALKAHAERGS